MACRGAHLDWVLRTMIHVGVGGGGLEETGGKRRSKGSQIEKPASEGHFIIEVGGLEAETLGANQH